jgi:hypothetical protein
MDALDLVRRGGDHCFQELRELVKFRGIDWLNRCRDRFGWGAVHYAAAGSLAGSNKSPEDGLRFLQWLDENEATMNQLSDVEKAGVPPRSTCLHVAVVRRQLLCLEFLLEICDESFINSPNSLGLSAPMMVVPFANAFSAYEMSQQKTTPPPGAAAAASADAPASLESNKVKCGFCATRTAGLPLHTNDVVDRLFCLPAFVPCDDCRTFFGRSALLESKP